MLVQSNNDIIELFPCIPDFMKNGKFRGLRAKGGVTVNGEWQDGKLKYAEIIPDFDGEYKLKYNEKEINVTATAGETVRVFC
jgi:alpha-L-fucosidase 2